MRVQVSATVDTGKTVPISGRPAVSLQTRPAGTFSETDEDAIWGCVYALWKSTPGIKAVHLTFMEEPVAKEPTS